jgi:hypothetical protein
MFSSKWLKGIGVLGLVAAAVGCGGGSGSGSSGSTTQNPQQTGQVFVDATDAPLPSVVSFKVDIMDLQVSDGTNTYSILGGTQTVDFARLNGLRTLLDINTIPAGTYTQVIATLANPSIDYLNVPNPQTNPPTRPTVSTLNTMSTSSPQLNLTQSQVTINLASPLTVSSGDIIGLRFEFDIKKSVAVDGNGQITGAITPTLGLKAVTPSDADAYIDEFDAGVVSVNASGNSFVIQGPFGHQFTVNTNQQTEWEGNDTINNLTTDSIVEISGTLDKTSATFLADTVAIVSQSKFWAGGLITFVEPQISTIDLTGNEKYFIHWWHDTFGSFLFNSSELIPGQHISIAGPYSNGQVTVNRVVLRHEGHSGTLVVGQTDTSAGTFEFNSNGLAGVLFDGPVTVQVTPFTKYLGGLTSLNDLTGTTALNLRVVGLVLKNPVNGEPIFIAHSVEQLTD